jgi:hypothetical protein
MTSRQQPQPNQPERGDVVLGGQAAMPTGSFILGGFEGLKQRLLSPHPKQRIAALSEALQHGQKGLNFVIRALFDSAPEVREAAVELLQDRVEPRVLKALERHYIRQHYAHLESLLIAQRWKTADQETRAVMLRTFGLEADQQLRADQIAEFPCVDLQIINQLWTMHSKGRFGFSVQRVIWRRYDTLFWNKADVWSAFADRVGWRINNLFKENYWKRHNELTFNLNAPAGHLPFLGDCFGIFTIEAIAKRLDSCNKLPF